MFRRIDNFRILSVQQGVCACLLMTLLSLAGCRHTPSAAGLATVQRKFAADTIVVPANGSWLDTGVELRAGDSVDLTATGLAACEPDKSIGRINTQWTGPQGTYLYEDAVEDQIFPLPAAGGGPAPAYSLIGRVGNGPPFFVGERMKRQVHRDGRLQFMRQRLPSRRTTAAPFRCRLPQATVLGRFRSSRLSP